MEIGIKKFTDEQIKEIIVDYLDEIKHEIADRIEEEHLLRKLEDVENMVLRL